MNRRNWKNHFSDVLKSVLVHKQLPWIAMLIGMLFGIPALWPGWGPSDDLIQRSIIQSSPLSVVLTRLYVFLDPAINSLQMDAGYYPWWTYEPARIIFFRPIAAFSLWLDYQVWPDAKFLMHLHNLLLYGLLCLVATHFLRRIMGCTPQAGLAAILFALSTAHIGCVVSLAARNLILTALFGFLAFIFHDRWRRDGWQWGLALAITFTLLSLLSAETGVAVCAYLFAYMLFLDWGAWRGRIASLLPYALVTVTWLLAYQFTGFGAIGSGFYLSPVQDPLRFGIAILERIPFILIGQWILPDPVVYTVLSVGARIVLWMLSVGILVFIGILLAPLIKSERTARFLALGMLLSVIPVCAVSPASGRHLTFISLGAFGLMGQFITGRLQNSSWTPGRKVWRSSTLVISILLLCFHGFIYPLAGSFVRPTLGSFAEAAIDFNAPAGIEEKDVILVNAPSPSLFIYLPSFREYYSKPLPAHLRILAPGFSPVTLTSGSENTLIIRPDSGFLVPPVSLSLDGTAFLPLFHSAYSFQYGDGLFRSASYPMEMGQQVDLAGTTVEVISLTEDGRPQAVRVTFDKPLSDESFTWLLWDWQSSSYVPFQPPTTGDTLVIPGPY